MASFERPRGTRDLGPAEMAQRRALETALRGVAASFGYREVQTPTFEHLELFTTKSGEAIEEELYAFKDKGDRAVTLRPELTAPVIRFYVNELAHEPKPLRLFYVGNCFRYERPQAGRYREFWQFGSELIGAGGPLADAEVVAFAYHCVAAARVPAFAVRVGHVGLLRELVGLIPCDDATRRKTYPLIDKDDEGLLDHLSAAGAPEPLARAIETVATFAHEVKLDGEPEVLLETTTHALIPVREAVAEAGLETDALATAETHLDHVARTLAALGGFGVPTAVLDLGVARGLDYYTGLVFEIEAEGLGAQKQVCGGGAYTLAELLGGQPSETAGFGIGFDRIAMVAGLEAPTQPVRAHIAPIGEQTQLPAARIATELRAAGIHCTLDIQGRGPSKNLDFASKEGIPFVVLLGSRELEAGRATVKDMESGTQEEVALGELAGRLAS